ncbi:hypothetical protein ACFWYW_17635 [Nonomuraea sp. NPDC059023]|uniref:hypothetical protein n=1 Tax=unclassified Nonomuraea TaxID=2593643 RepID=UPI0036875071
MRALRMAQAVQFRAQLALGPFQGLDLGQRALQQRGGTDVGRVLAVAGEDGQPYQKVLGEFAGFDQGIDEPAQQVSGSSRRWATWRRSMIRS